MDHALISIIIINYNTFELTSKCIQSILSIESNLPSEIILVDNHSTEADPDEFLKIFPGIILIKSPANIGFAKGNNLGIEKAKGAYILLLNSDTVLLNDAITIVKQFLDSHPNVAAASARLEYPDGAVQHNCQRFPSVSTKLFELLRLQKILGRKMSGKVLLGSFFGYDSIAYPDWIWGTFFMFRKERLDGLPGKKLADDFFMYGEDMQWCMEFKYLGFRCAFLPDAHVVHLMGGSGGEGGKMMRLNLNAFMKLYYPGWQRLFIRTLNFFLTGRYEY